MVDRDRIAAQVSHCLTETNFDQLGKKYHGKVRDTYDLGDRLLLITTDRQSAFDRILAAIPFKGQVLNQVSAWWFEHTKDIVPNHVLSVPDPNALLAKKCTVFPVEFVVRGFLTGVTSTSAWMAYSKGERNFCGNILSDGMVKDQAFPKPIITPTTKSDQHDESITPNEIISRGLMSPEDWQYCSEKSLQIFARGQKLATEHGLTLVDTKYEFGKLPNGEIILVDEVHTPDSSRYWLAGTHENIDKEFLRLWFMKHCDPYNDKELPAAPEDLIMELSARYIQLYETITGQEFVYPDRTILITERLHQNLIRPWLLAIFWLSYLLIMAEPRPRGIRLGIDHRNPDQARQDFERTLLQQGGIEFNMLVGESTKRVVALPEVVRPTAISGDIETKRSVLHRAQMEAAQRQSEFIDDVKGYVAITGSGFDFGDEHYRLDLLDAPAELQAAVQKKWEALLANEKIVDADAPQALRDELALVRSRYEAIASAMRSAKPLAELPVAVIEDFPEHSTVPYDQVRMNRIPASDQEIFASYRAKGWRNLGKKQREHYQALKARLEATQEADAAKWR